MSTESQRVIEWTPVSDSLPEPNALVHGKWRVGHSRQYESTGLVRLTDGVFLAHGNKTANPVTHWRPWVFDDFDASINWDGNGSATTIGKDDFRRFYDERYHPRENPYALWSMYCLGRNLCSGCYSRGGPSHTGSSSCESGSLASGGNRSHCTCDRCF